MTKLNEMAEEYILSKHEGQGPCLVPNADAKFALSCHENDFCECEIKGGFKAGYLAALESSEVRDMEGALDVIAISVVPSIHSTELERAMCAAAKTVLASFRKMRADFDKESGK